ncbi:Fic family protein [Candidatus Pacearchaeota archaeon]|nr:Fic family protein [Candidatus Pacearchaeota archaeon]
MEDLYKEIENGMTWFSAIQNNRIPENMRLYFWSSVVWSGIAGKYPDINEEIVYALAKEWTEAELNNENIILQDVNNQFNALNKLEYDWDQRKFDLSYLIDLYTTAIGTSNGVDSWRKSQFEISNGFTTQLLPKDIITQMNAFGSFLEAANFIIENASVQTILWIVSFTHSRIIYIHPFPDGNGRVARILVNAILHRGGFPYIPIPKVKNSQSLLCALQESFKGNYNPLLKEYANLLNESLSKVHEEFY